MIVVNGYKAFHGIMRIHPKSKCVPVIEKKGDWLYKPKADAWYCEDVSYPAKMCTVVRDDSESVIQKKPIIKTRKYISSDDDFFAHTLCPNCSYMLINEDTRGLYKGKKLKHCPVCGQALDWSAI